eukprot:GFUD01013242.1.p1 GENE.GFUD01013242.1~~GFUD01013242.1.p1  ORF type:complete len:453 (-),score=106.04 GFUD01013242.1:37-1395(-)
MAICPNEVSLSSEIPWLEKPRKSPGNFYQSHHILTPQVKLLSGDGFSVSVPLPLLLATSHFFRTVLTSYQCCGGVDISLPSVGGGTLILVTEILRSGETSNLEVAENAKASLKDVQAVLGMLQCDITIALQQKNSTQSQTNSSESECMDGIRQENILSDLNSNSVQIESPLITSGATSPCISASSSITLSPTDVKEVDFKPSLPLLYIDVTMNSEIGNQKKKVWRASIKKHKKEEIVMTLRKEEIVRASIKEHKKEEIVMTLRKEEIVMTPKKEEIVQKLKEETKKVNDNGKASLSCPFCQRKLRNEKSLNQHLELLHPEPIFSCTKCEFSFYKKRSLEKHARLVHPKYRCKTCLMSFSSKAKLSCHNQIRHRESHKCINCEDRFTSSEKLKAHMNVAHPESDCDEHMDLRFSCNVCYKIFKTKPAFMSHCEEMSHDPSFVTKFRMPDSLNL